MSGRSDDLEALAIAAFDQGWMECLRALQRVPSHVLSDAIALLIKNGPPPQHDRTTIIAEREGLHL